MSDSEKIEKDLREYLDKEPNLSRADRLSYLKTVFNKHFEIDKLDHLVTDQDLLFIFSDATKKYIKTKLPLKVGKRVLDANESVHIAIMESFIMYLNRMKLLRKLVNFDYKE